MKDITTHTTELLQLHDCVVLPNFGGFVASYNSAIINTTNGLVLPPYKNILFNKNLVHNDGLLAHYIVENSNCTMPQALAIIEQYVQNISTQITISKRVEMLQLGVFYLDNENRLLFRQHKTETFSLASYGLPSFTANKLIVQVTPIALNNSIALPAETVATTAVVRKLNYKRLAIAAVTIPALIALVWASINIKQLQNNNFAGFWALTTTTVKPAMPMYDKTYFEQRMKKAEQNITNCKHAIDSLTQLIVHKAQADTTRVVNSTAIIAQQITFTKYYLIAGCFSDTNNAVNYVAELKQQGYPNALIIDGNINGLTRVAYGGYASKNDAQQVKNKLTAINAGAWIVKTMN